MTSNITTQVNNHIFIYLFGPLAYIHVTTDSESLTLVTSGYFTIFFSFSHVRSLVKSTDDSYTMQ